MGAGRWSTSTTASPWLPTVGKWRFRAAAPNVLLHYLTRTHYPCGCSDKPRPAFVHSKDYRELWQMLIEKAYAQYHGSYTLVEGGHVHQAMVDLTGGSAEFYNLQYAGASLLCLLALGGALSCC